jgi:hypothetical protein
MTEKKTEEKGTVPSIKLGVGLVAEVAKNEVDFAGESGAVPRQAASVWVVSRFIYVSWGKG